MCELFNSRLMVGRSFRFSARRLCDEKYKKIPFQARHLRCSLANASPSHSDGWCAQAMSSCFPFAFNNFVFYNRNEQTHHLNSTTNEKKEKKNVPEISRIMCVYDRYLL